MRRPRLTASPASPRIDRDPSRVMWPRSADSSTAQSDPPRPTRALGLPALQPGGRAGGREALAVRSTSLPDHPRADALNHRAKRLMRLRSPGRKPRPVDTSRHGRATASSSTG